MRLVGGISKLLGVAVACAAFLSATSSQARPNEAVVRGVRGTANYSGDRGANWKKLNVGMKLGQNSVIRTAPGSSVDLFLGDNGPVVRVTEDTTLGIDRLTVDQGAGNEKIIETQLDLRNGRILGNVKHLAAASKYEVKTPQGVAGIRGTRYDIRADGSVTVIDGQVVVVYIVNGQASTVTVNAGQTSTPPREAGGAPPVVQTPIEVIRADNQMIDQAGRGGEIATTEGVPTVILTVEPIKEHLNPGVEKIFQPELIAAARETPAESRILPIDFQ
jgi:ferric-dicitrate binding protein FerR (iron transport regulator)